MIPVLHGGGGYSTFINSVRGINSPFRHLIFVTKLRKFLVERVEANLAELPSGVTVRAAVVTVDGEGRVPIQVANFSMNDVYLNPRTPVAALSPFDLWPSFEFVSVAESHVRLREVSSGYVVTENDAVDAILIRMDVGDLPEPQQERLLQVMGKYWATFSESKDDLAFCDLVKHKIVTTEERPIKVPRKTATVCRLPAS